MQLKNFITWGTTTGARRNRNGQSAPPNSRTLLFWVILTQEWQNIHIEKFCSAYNFINLIKDPTCFKNPETPTTIVHILTNHLKCFQNSGVYESIPFKTES